MSELSFDVHGYPSPQGSKRLVGIARNRPTMIDANPPHLKAWRRAVEDAAREAAAGVDWAQLVDTPCSLRVTFTMPASIVTARSLARLPRRLPSHRMPDLDKLVRSTMDALTTAGIWADDRLVAQLRAEKIYARSIGALDRPGASIIVKAWNP